MKSMFLPIFLALLTIPILAQDRPKVFLDAQSTGNTWGSMRDQSQEMAKDFASECPETQVTTDQSSADYRIKLNHIEVGMFLRDNQLAVVDMGGKVISTQEKGGVKSRVKGACAVILADWSDQSRTRQKLIAWIDRAANQGMMIYVDISGDTLTVHSERANAMRFHMLLASQRELPMMRRAGIATFVYTNDGDQVFTFDLKSGKTVETPIKAAAAVQ